MTRTQAAVVRDKPILFSGAMVRSILSDTKTQTRRVLKTPRGCPKDYVYTPGALVDPAMGWWQDPKHDRVGWSSTLPYSAGDRLWVREGGESLRYATDHDPANREDVWSVVGWRHAADGAIIGCNGETPADYIDDCSVTKRPSIFMPRWASRITLEVAAVRVDRLHDITEADCFAEGLEKLDQTIGRDGQIVPTRPYACNEGWNQQRTDYDDGELIEGGVYSQFGWDDPKAVYADLWESINGAGSWDANPFVAAIEFRRVVTIGGCVEPVREIANAE